MFAEPSRILSRRSTIKRIAPNETLGKQSAEEGRRRKDSGKAKQHHWQTTFNNHFQGYVKALLKLEYRRLKQSTDLKTTQETTSIQIIDIRFNNQLTQGHMRFFT